jgi:hypothetical protein
MEFLLFRKGWDKRFLARATNAAGSISVPRTLKINSKKSHAVAPIRTRRLTQITFPDCQIFPFSVNPSKPQEGPLLIAGGAQLAHTLALRNAT